MSFAAPNMTASGAVDAKGSWSLGDPGVDFSQNFTVEAWVFLAQSPAPGQATIFQAAGPFALTLSQGFLGAGTASGHAQAPEALAQETWCYVAATYDGTTLSLFVDGALEAKVPLTLDTAATGPCQIGPAGAGTTLEVWSIAVYDYARTADEQAEAQWQDVVPAPGLAAYYDFSQAPPSETSGAELSIVPNGDASAQTLAPMIYFPGSSSVAIGSAPPVMPPYTISAWVALNGVPGAQTVFCSGHHDGNSVSLSFGDGQVGIVHTDSGHGFWKGGPVAVAPGDWHNYAATNDGSNVCVYLDGDLVVRGSIAAPGAEQPGGWLIGATNSSKGTDAFLQGGVQWLSVWSRALAPEEVAWQQYQEVGLDRGIVVDLAMDQVPLVDVAQQRPARLIGAARFATQRVPVTSWTPPPEQLSPTAWRTIRSTPLPASTPDVSDLASDLELFGDDHLAALLADAEPFLAQLPDGVQADTRESYAGAARAALDRAREDPGGFGRVASWRREGEEEVFVYHGPDGDVELERLAVGTVTPCTMWWINFLFTLHAGVFSAFAFTLNGKALHEWLKANVLGDSALMQQLANLLLGTLEETGGAVPASFVLNLLKAYDWSKVKSLFWNVVWKSGWFALGRALAWLAAKVFVGNALAVALFLKDLLMTAVDLTTQFVGTPDAPGYNACCGTNRPAAATVE
jgi:hypothetical protein